ncbi:Homeobox protein cut-like ceh-44 [Trichinella pseudospiralis]|uniref:Homeobox protein cut-like n=1 Tax=Trichinella pseudospiralis TaxID=6337 RepID=A0A0V1EB88_TRIPS|nr:Homeobox protein cut-like ceh-44 [Trichinella pseudospiralis]
MSKNCTKNGRTTLGQRFREWRVHSEVGNQYLSIADVGEKLSILQNPVEKANLHSISSQCKRSLSQPVYRAEDELVAVALNWPWSESGYRSAPANLTITHQAIEKIVRPTGVHVLAIDRPQRLQSRTALTPTWSVEQRRHCTIIVYYNTDNPHLAIIFIIIIFCICIFSYQNINFGGEFIVKKFEFVVDFKVKAQNNNEQYIQKKQSKKDKQNRTATGKGDSNRITNKLDNVDQNSEQQHVMQAEQYAYNTIDVEAICEFWKTFDLPALQKELDETAAELANRQDESECSRQKLIENSREYKKNTPEDIRKRATHLLKSFQAEVDWLSKRSKAAEAAFLKLYKQVIEWPNPAPALKMASISKKLAKRMQDLESENRYLRSELEALRSQMYHLAEKDAIILHLREMLKNLECKLTAEFEAKLSYQEEAGRIMYENRERQLQKFNLFLCQSLKDARERAEAMRLTLSELSKAKPIAANHSSAYVDSDTIMTSPSQLNNGGNAAADFGSVVENCTSPMNNIKTDNEENCAESEHGTKMFHFSESCENEGKNNSLQLNAESSDSDEHVSQVQQYVDMMASVVGSELVNSYREWSCTVGLELELDAAQKAMTTSDQVSSPVISVPSLPAVPTACPAPESSTLSASSLNAEPVIDLGVEAVDESKKRSAPGVQLNNGSEAGLSGAGVELEAVGMSSADWANVRYLQSVLAWHVDQQSKVSGDEPLDTAEIARQCRRVLTEHNIGQRLIAKYVLNQSQGAVSELLSKPKKWSSLTERSKNSFRRLKAWLSDQQAVLALRNISPKRTSCSARDRYANRSQMDSATEARIVHILQKAKQAREEVQLPLVVSDRGAASSTVRPMSASPVSSSNGEGSSVNRDRRCQSASTVQSVSGASFRCRPGRYRHDDIPKSKIHEIYERELAKLRNHDGGILITSDQQTPTVPALQPSDLSVVVSNSTLVPAFTGLSSSTSSAGSNRCASASPPTRTFKAVLPPITQEQFERFGRINTEKLVQRVKEHLLQYSISQRVFGEQVLGLSQGSVSDLLARPKAWHMLTQKGREPFIRMHAFLEDNELLKKLITSRKASQNSSNGGGGGGGSRSSSSGSQIEIQAPGFEGSAVFTERSLNNVGQPTSKVVLVNETPTSPLSTTAICDSYAVPLDTVAIVEETRAVLAAHSIGQKLFGEAVLHLSQGFVSDLLSKPKPWEALSAKRKEALLRMQAWLKDADRIKKINEYQARKNFKRLANCDPIQRDSAISGQYVAYSQLDVKRPRVTLTKAQKEQLIEAFNREPYPSVQMTSHLSVRLGLHVSTVANWFQNRRMRQKAALQQNTAMADNGHQVDRLCNGITVCNVAGREEPVAPTVPPLFSAVFNSADLLNQISLTNGLDLAANSLRSAGLETSNNHTSSRTSSTSTTGSSSYGEPVTSASGAEQPTSNYLRRTILHRMETNLVKPDVSWVTEEDRSEAINRIENRIKEKDQIEWEF